MTFTISHAEAYDRFFPKHIMDHYTRKRVDFLRKFVSKNSKILDVGCGTGNIIIPMSDFYNNTYGTDESPNMIKKARQKSKKVRFYVCSATKLKFPDNFFDLTYCIATFHHIKTPMKVRKSLSEMLRVTKLGGYVVIIDHNSKNPYWKLLLKKIPWDKDTRLIPLKEFKMGLGENDIEISYQSFVPEFCPKKLLKLFSGLEKIIERTVLGRFLAAHVAIIVKKIR